MKSEQTFKAVEETWPVTVIYDGPEQRRRALEMCDGLMSRFWAELEFDFQWWPSSALWENTSAKAAGDHARKAKMILLALQPGGDLDAALRRWLERSLSERVGGAGALIVLFAGAEGEQPDPRKETWLRDLSERCGLDFFVSAVPAVPESLPATVEEYRSRADLCGSVMESILRQPHLPPFLL